MDWAQDPELIEVFDKEMRERSERLAQFCRALANRTLSESKFVDALRDAHTMKGNASVMGHKKVSDAVAVVEGVWTEVVSGLGGSGTSFGNLMAEVVESVMASLDDSAVMEPHLVALCDANGVPLPESWIASDKDDVPSPGSLSKTIAATLVDNTPTAPELVGDGEATFHSLATDQPDLGGMIGRLPGLMAGESMKVETSRLRATIDQSATVRLDAEALVVALRKFANTPESRQWLKAAQGLVRGVRQLQEGAESLGSEPITSITQSIRQLGGYLARQQGKEVEIEIIGADFEVDRGLLDIIREPLRHLVVNAVEHGIEDVSSRIAAGKSGRGIVTISFAKEDETLRLVVSDDGTGVDWSKVESCCVENGLTQIGASTSQLTSALFEEGFSTAVAAGEFSGDGAGLDIVVGAVCCAHGGLLFDTQPGLGSRVEMRLPISSAMLDVLPFDCANERWSLPVASIVGVHEFNADNVSSGLWHPEYLFEGRRLPFSSMSEALALESGAPLEHVIVLAARGARIAIGVPAVYSVRRAALRRLGGVMSGIEFLAGVGVLGGGETVAVVDPDYLGGLLSRPRPKPVARPKVLVVDDSLAVRQVMVSGLTSLGFEVDAVGGVIEGLSMFDQNDYDVVVIDLYLEDGDGIDVLRGIRARSKMVPVVMVSGVAHQVDRQRGLDAGANFFFDKSDLRKGAFIDTLRTLAMNVEEASI